MGIRRIGQIFVDLGFISDEQLVTLVEEQKQQSGVLIGKIAIEMGLLDGEQLVNIDRPRDSDSSKIVS